MCVVAQEQHKLNGEYHLHAIIAFKRQRDIYGSRLLDLPRTLGRDYITLEDDLDYHAHIEGVLDYKHCLQYTCKEDAAPYMYNMTMDQVRAMVSKSRRTFRKMPDGTLFPIAPEDITPAILPSVVTRSATAGKPKVSDEVAKRLLDGATIEDIVTEYPGYVLQNLQKLSLFQSKVALPSRATQALLPWTPDLITSSHPDLQCSRTIIRWLQDNILKSRHLRQKQLYIHGPPGCGKTSLLMWLRRYLVTYDIPRHEKYYDLIHHGIQLTTMDEVTGANKSIQEWNSWLDGSDITLPVKGAQWLKTLSHHNWPTILCSNFAPNHIYRNADSVAIEAFLSRLVVVRIPDHVLLQFHMAEPSSPNQHPDCTTTTQSNDPSETQDIALPSIQTDAYSAVSTPQLAQSGTVEPNTTQMDALSLLANAARVQLPTTNVDPTIQRARAYYESINPNNKETHDNPYILSRYRAGMQQNSGNPT